MLVLPTGQILMSDGIGKNLYLYTHSADNPSNDLDSGNLKPGITNITCEPTADRSPKKWSEPTTDRLPERPTAPTVSAWHLSVPHATVVSCGALQACFTAEAIDRQVQE
jgi:hypothetical protein